jgi:hypothetical protein
MITPEEALQRAEQIDPTAERFIVRLWDGFDGEWMDVTEPVGPEQAMHVWGERTEQGTRCVSYSEIDYYAIFPSGVVMKFSAEGVGSQTRADRPTTG